MNELAETFRLVRCDHVGNIAAIVDHVTPHVICFEFDTPDGEGLRRLRETKLRYPSTPILMLSDPPSAELAIWALRTRVWDYFIRPVTAGEIARRINILAQITLAQRDRRTRPVYLPQQMIPSGAAMCDDCKDGGMQPTAPALAHVQRHFRGRVSLAEVAGLCGMDSYEFSRRFKRTHGVTFRDYLIRYRLDAAASLLRDTRMDVLDIALGNGFNDASHFSRSFRRHYGLTPSAYRLEYEPLPAGTRGVPLQKGSGNDPAGLPSAASGCDNGETLPSTHRYARIQEQTGRA